MSKISKLAFVLITLLTTFTAAGKQSVCYGTTANGRLEHAVKLPGEGNNFVSYSNLAGFLGRTYVHSKTADILLDAYRTLETELPGKVYKYAETGFASGGRFKPHKTHQNGLSVDFMVPVVDASGRSVHLPTHPLNKFGYNIEFNQEGQFEDYRIDFNALAAHIVALHKAATKHEVEIWRVIFDLKLQPKLFATEYGPYLKSHIQFSTRPSWVRHDEHYHVDFAITCRDMTK